MNNPYKLFATNQSEEQIGVFVNYGDFRVKVARAGGSNLAYAKALDRKARALRRMGTPSATQTRIMMHELTAETCVRDWQVKQAGNWVQGIAHPETAEIMPFNLDNVKLVFTAFPDLAEAITGEANSMDLFQQPEVVEEQGN